MDDHLFDLENNLPYVINEYTLRKVIGRGGFAICFLAENESLGLTFCIKVLSKSLTDLSNYMNKMEICSSLAHEGIAKIYEYFENELFFFIVLEYCPGSLRCLIRSRVLSDPGILKRYIYQILFAINFCHQKNIAHCDLKPSNILLSIDEKIKIIDFSNAVQIVPNQKVMAEVSSPSYAPPEVILDQEYDPIKADIWSLGVTFYEMAVGYIPWPQINSAVLENAIIKGKIEIPSVVPNQLANIIYQMLSHNPEARPNLLQIIRSDFFSITPLPFLCPGQVGAKGRQFRSNSNNRDRESICIVYSHFGGTRSPSPIALQNSPRIVRPAGELNSSKKRLSAGILGSFLEQTT